MSKPGPGLVDSTRRLNVRQASLIALPVAALGTIVVWTIFAAGTPIGFEAESGTLAGGATTTTTSGASGGSAVKFGSDVATSPTPTATTVPAQCASGGTYLWSNLGTCGWPGPTTTGYVAADCPSGLTNVGSSATAIAMTLSTAGATIACENITGGVQITAQNVTIKDSKITFSDGGKGGDGVININDGASATVSHVEINGTDSTHACIWDEGIKGPALAHSMVADAVNCHDVDDGIFSWWWSSDKNLGAGSDFVIQDSYFHDFTEDAANGHIDGYQTEGAQNGLIQHNTYDIEEVPGDKTVSGGGLDSAIALWDDWNQSTQAGKVTTNITADNNLITGGGFAMYAEDYSPDVNGAGNGSGGNTITDIHFTNNKYSNVFNKCVGDFGIYFYRSSWTPYFGGPTDLWNSGGSSLSGNVLIETGQSENTGNNVGLPSGCG